MRRFLPLLGTLGLVAPAHAQLSDAHWLETFLVPGVHGGYGFYSVTALERDGADLYAGGDFEVVDDTRAPRVAHWDGEAWHALGGGVRGSYYPADNSTVHALLPEPGEALVVGGLFLRAVQPDGDTLSVPGVARWTGTTWEGLGRGLRDTNSSSFNQPFVFALAREASGAVVVGGQFNRAVNPDGTEVPAGNLARWNGAAWEAIGTVGGRVYALAVGPEGAIYVGGAINGITSADGTPTAGRGLFRYHNGTWSLVGGGVGGQYDAVRALAFVGSDLYVGGSFGQVRQPDGTPLAAGHFARWTGTAWQSVGGASGEIHDLDADGEGGVWVGGAFGQVGGQPSMFLARWTGTAWEPTAPRIWTDDPSPSQTVHAVVADGADAAVAGGQFPYVELDVATRAGFPVQGLVRYAAGTWMPFGGAGQGDGLGALRPRVRALAACGGDVIAGGHFLWVGPHLSRSLARWEGADWVPLGTALRSPLLDSWSYAEVGAIAPAPDCATSGAFYIGGFFAGAGSVNSSGVLYWNGTAWESVGGGVGGFSADAVVATPEGVCVDGSPSYPRKFACWSRTAGWLPTGDVGAGEVYALARPTDGKVYVGGTFTQVFQLDGMPVVARNIARWTGTAWEHIGGPTGVALGEVSVKALTVGPDGALYVGGRFDAVYQPDGTLLAADRAARFDGATWSALPSPGGHTVEALAFGPDGRLYAAGTHGTEPNGALSEAGVAVLDVSAETWHPLGTGLGGRGEALAFDGVGRLFVGGWFDVAGGKGSPGLAVWNAPIAVPAEPLVPEAPRAVVLYPNPARGATTIAFALYAAGLVRVAAYDALGRRVAVLTDGARAAGQHTLTLDTSGLPGGVYVVRVEAGGHTQSRLLTVLR